VSTVFCNGDFVEREDARLSAFDAGLQHGVGLFETMPGVNDAEGPRIVGLREHLDRLATSARELRLSEDLSVEALGEAALETVRRSGLDRTRVRLTVTGGDLNLLQARGETNATPTVLIDAQPATAYPEAMFENGVTVTVAGSRANPLDPTSSHKTLNYWWRLRELQVAASRGGGEALVFDVTNHLCGGCVSNAIVIKGDRAMTPIVRGEERGGGVPSPVLPGVTRAMALGWLEDAGLTVHRRMLAIDDVLDADEVVLTNSGFGVLPVVRIEASALGVGSPGAAGRGLVERWRGLFG